MHSLFLTRPIQWGLKGLFVGVLAGLLTVLPACSVTLPGNTGGGDGNTGENPVPEDKKIVSLRMANLTDAAVDVEIYVSSNGEHITPETLFVEGNLYTDGIGLAATGLLAPDSADSVDIECSEGMVIGTTGGTFYEVETGEELGVGSARILQHGLVFDCGARVTLVFREENGVYSAELQLE